MYRGPQTREALVTGDAPPAMWVRGQVFGDRWMQAGSWRCCAGTGGREDQ